MKIAFVCTGNTCRSPMAEHMFRYYREEQGDSEPGVVSAGVSAGVGQPAAPAARRVLEDHGIESIRRHASRPVSDLNLEAGDYVFTMTGGHKQAVQAEVPEGVKVELLKEALGQHGGISDPFGGDVEVYRDLFEELRPLVKGLLNRFT